MGFTIEWENEDKNLIHVVYDDSWTWEDYRESMREAGNLCRTVEHTVHLIFEFSLKRSLSPGSPLANFQRTLGYLPDNAGLRVIVGTHEFIAQMAALFARRFAAFMSDRLFFVSDLEQAYQIITRQTREQ